MASVWQIMRPFLFALGEKTPIDAIKMLIQQAKHASSKRACN
jgi:hypothetical protein